MAAFDHVIVGAGISGMTAAILLAEQGRSVAVAESFRKPAPTIRGFRRKGVHFDTGVHYVGGLGRGQVLDAYFAHLGLDRLLTTVPYKADGFDVIAFEESGREFRMPNGYQACRDYLCAEFPEETKAVDTYFREIRRNFDASPFLNFERAFSMDGFLHDDTITLQNFLDSITDNATLKTLFSYQCLLYGVPPHNALLSTHSLVAGSYCRSAHTIRGGGRALAKAYEKRLAELGVGLFCNCEAGDIVLSPEKRLRGVQLSTGEVLETGSCIWTAQPSALADAVPEGVFRPSYRLRLRELRGSASGTMLFGVSDSPVPELDGRCRYIWPGGDFESKLEGDPLPDDNLIYLSSCLDQKSGKTVITVIFPGTIASFARWEQSAYGDRPESYKNFKRQLAEKLVATLRRRCPELSGVDFLECATPLTVRDYCSTPQGALYGPRHSNDQYNPAPVTKLDGLYLAGQGIVAPGVLGAVVSAYLACGIILGHESLHQELRQCA